MSTDIGFLRSSKTHAIHRYFLLKNRDEHCKGQTFDLESRCQIIIKAPDLSYKLECNIESLRLRLPY